MLHSSAVREAATLLLARWHSWAQSPENSAGTFPLDAALIWKYCKEAASLTPASQLYIQGTAARQRLKGKALQSFAVARLLCLEHEPKGQGKKETVQMGRELFPRQSSCAGHWSHRIVRHSWAMPTSVVHRPFREDAWQGMNSQTCTKGRRATSPNPSQTITAAVVTARGYSCKPDLHRGKKKNQNTAPPHHNLGNLISKGVKKPGGNLLYCKKNQGGHQGESPSYCPWNFYQNSPRPEQSLGQEEREAAEIFRPLHTSPLDFPQTAPTWQTVHHEEFKEITRREMPVSIELASKSSQCSFQQQAKSKEIEKKRCPGS